MRKLLTWLVVTIGIAALVRKLRRRGTPEASVTEAPAPEPEAGADDPAEELRRKLASSRGDEGVAGAPVEEQDPSVEERRSGVHEQGRAAIDEMQRSTEE